MQDTTTSKTDWLASTARYTAERLEDFAEAREEKHPHAHEARPEELRTRGFRLLEAYAHDVVSATVDALEEEREAGNLEGTEHGDATWQAADDACVGVADQLAFIVGLDAPKAREVEALASSSWPSDVRPAWAFQAFLEELESELRLAGWDV